MNEIPEGRQVPKVQFQMYVVKSREKCSGEQVKPHHQHLNLCHHLVFSGSVSSHCGDNGAAFSFGEEAIGSNGRVLAVELGRLGLMPSRCCLRAATTRRTRTVVVFMISLFCMESWIGIVTLTRKRLFNIDHFPRARLHESISPRSCPFQSISCADLSHTLQIAFIPRDQTYRQDLPSFHAIFALLIDELVEVFEGFERVVLGDVVDEEKGIAVEVGVGPEAAVFFLACRVGEGEGVGRAVYDSRDGVRVFDGWVVSVVEVLLERLILYCLYHAHTRVSIDCGLDAE